MSEHYVGQVMMTGFGFPPKGFALCNGQLLPVQQSSALFALLGISYGGNGTTNFGLPDLRGRAPIGANTSVDGNWQPTPYSQGTSLGVENVTLMQAHLPPHAHQHNATTKIGAGRAPAGFSARSSNGDLAYAPPGQMVPLAGAEVSGSNIAHNNMQPYCVINFTIALTGIYPSRN